MELSDTHLALDKSSVYLRHVTVQEIYSDVFSEKVDMSDGQPSGPLTTNSDDNRTRSNWRQYADAVQRHANRSEQTSLYSGNKYESIAQYLQSDTVRQNGETAYNTYTPKKRLHPFAILHDLAYSREDSRYLTTFSGSEGPQSFTDHGSPQPLCGQLLFLRGWPSPAWINAIGIRYRINPEIFRRHLQFGQKSGYADLPNLPSSSHNIIRLSMSTLGSCQALSIRKNTEHSALYNHFRELQNKPDSEGNSIIRQLWIHDSEHFSIEQNALISLLQGETGWLSMFFYCLLFRILELTS